ncbi:MAG: RluA family pseudouridine synthase [Candidatus Kuenenia sp.]|nr:RluA family pseudouridine synthase [Candidatus Kuenenia hertensis]
MRKFVVTQKDSVLTLLHFIADRLSLSNKKAKQLLDDRLVFVNRKRVWIASYQLKKGDNVEVLAGKTTQSEKRTYDILFQDNYYLIVSKPPDIVTNGPDSLENDLRAQLNNKHIRAVHRLDKNTSGVLIFAKNESAFEEMKKLFKKHEIQKIYRVMVMGKIGKTTFSVNSPIGGQPAVTHVQLLKKGENSSYLEVSTETGRRHQIRIHLASIGHPLIGETEYTRKHIENTLHREMKRQMLHAYRISFVHPYTHQKNSATARIPHDFEQCLRVLVS